MKPSILFHIFFIAIVSLYLAGCSRHLISVSTTPQNGAPGDIVIVKLKNARADTNMQVQIGNQKALVISASDSSAYIMVPTLVPGATKLSITINKQQAQTDFTVDTQPSLGLWFSLKNGKATFVKAQPTNEEFKQDKSYSVNKMMYELVNKSGAQLAVGYINDPTEVEVLQADKTNLAKANIGGEVIFHITVPALQGISAIRLTSITAASNYKPALIGEIPVDLSKQ